VDDLDGTSRPAPPTTRTTNERGVVAEHYFDLQSLGLVERARAARAVEPASEESWVRTALQAAELALYNMADVLRRAAGDLEAAELDGCATKLSWLRGFHRVLTQLSAATDTYTTGRALVRPDPPDRLCIADSPALAEYLEAHRAFGEALEHWWEGSEQPPDAVLAQEPLTSSRFSILHLARIVNHESTIWERPLVAVAVPVSAATGTYAEFTASATLREAVREHELTGDSYFTQFRGLHQIPELIAAEMNELLEQAIRALRAREVEASTEALVSVNLLTQPVAACLPVLVDNLATRDYHGIRENLGLTSGSHSVGIRYHLFTHLYEQLCDEIAVYARERWHDGDGDGVPAAMRAGMTAGAHDGGVATLMGQLLAFRTFIFQWRAEHLHLPRNNLGGGGTKSLTGSPDAIGVVNGMMEHARASDPARAFYDDPARALDPEGPGPLTSMLHAAGSTDEALMLATGRLTQGTFVEVQERLGFFANRCPFVKPPRRMA
jgi:hypothetical protein